MSRQVRQQHRIGAIGVEVNMLRMPVLVHAWSTRTIICPKRKHLDVHLTDFDLSQFVCFLACEDFGVAWVDSKTMRFRTYFEILELCLSCFKELAIMSTSSAERRFEISSPFFITQFGPQALIYPSFNVFSIGDWRTELER